ncbi:MAG: hypothetical protein AAGG50_10070 [Bacteroidota bacterium]
MRSSLRAALLLLTLGGIGCVDDIGTPYLLETDPPTLRVVTPAGNATVTGDVLLASASTTDLGSGADIFVSSEGVEEQRLISFEPDTLRHALLALDAVFAATSAPGLDFVAVDGASNQTRASRTLRRSSSAAAVRLETGLRDTQTLARAPDGSVWFLTESGLGVYRAGTFEAHPLDGTEPDGLAIGSDGTVWLVEAATRRLFRYEDGRARLAVTLPLRPEPRFAVAPDGALWFASRSRVLRWDGNGEVETLELPSSGSFEIRGIAFAPSGVVWVATSLDIFQYDGAWQRIAPERFGLGVVAGNVLISDPDRLLVDGITTDGAGVPWVMAVGYLRRLDGPWVSLDPLALGGLSLDDSCDNLIILDNYPVRFAPASNDGLWFTARDFVIRRDAAGTMSGFSGLFEGLDSCIFAADIALAGDGRLLVLREASLVALDV